MEGRERMLEPKFLEIGEMDLTVYPADFVEALLVGQIAAQVRVH